VKVVCEHCGLPFSVARPTPGRAAYCCSGCALAARVSADVAAGAPPASPLLVGALGTGFLFFNQLLLWLLAVLLAREAEGAWLTPDALVVGSLGLACAVWNILAAAQYFSGARRAVDWLLLALSGALLIRAIWVADPAFAAAATTLLGAWALRGLAKKKVPRKK
jgi:hypothetical protein